jgi:hypothetical protein
MISDLTAKNGTDRGLETNPAHVKVFDVTVASDATSYSTALTTSFVTQLLLSASISLYSSLVLSLAGDADELALSRDFICRGMRVEVNFEPKTDEMLSSIRELLCVERTFCLLPV